MPVEFLSDHEAVAFGRYGESVPQADLERFFFLDDAERELVTGLRGDQNRLGFSLQLTTARYIGRFLADPLEGVPTEVLDFLAGQYRELIGHWTVDPGYEGSREKVASFR